MRTAFKSELVCVTLDARNAFNSIFRSALLEALVGPFSSLRGYFRSAYAASSRLLFRSEDAWIVISSTCGGKQGDTAMPALFSLAIHPCFVDVGALFDIHIFGYLDDITIVGRPGRVALAIPEISARLFRIGLNLNTSKCDVYGGTSLSVPIPMRNLPISLPSSTMPLSKLFAKSQKFPKRTSAPDIFGTSISLNVWAASVLQISR